VEENADADLPQGLPRPGDVIANKYELGETLGVGGMGAVFAGRDRILQRRVAIKFLLPEAAPNSESRARFLREAQAAGSIRSEHVVTVFETGMMEPDLLYLVMEYLPGSDLAAIVREPGLLEVDRAVDYVLQAAEALAEAHAVGIIHRDIKPSNLFVTERADGSPLLKVLDFGISKAISDQTGLTQTAVMMGSPRYMSPEQLRDVKQVDGRTDVWSLGVVLYELLCKRPPFQGNTITSVAIVIASEPPPPIGEVRADVPPELEAVILRALEKDPNRRIATVGELGGLLLPFVTRRGAFSFGKLPAVPPSGEKVEKPSSQPRSDKGVRVLVDATESTTRAMATTHQQTFRPRRSRRSAFAIGAIAGLVAVGAGASVVTRVVPTGPGVHATPAASPAPEPVASPIPPTPPASVGASSDPQAAPAAAPASAEAPPVAQASSAHPARPLVRAPRGVVPRGAKTTPAVSPAPATSVALPPSGEPPGRDRL
jgi:serine/threonine-protein kinase